MNNIINLTTSTGFTSPEISLLKAVLDNIVEDNSDIEISYKEILKTINEDEYINEAGIGGEVESNSSSKNIGKKIKQYFSLFKNELFTNDFLKKFRKEIIYKTDIYGLGRVLEDIYDSLKLKNKKIYGLIHHMIELNHDKRFSVEQCLNYIDN